ncbi:MAG: DNA alkylation repair protein [Acidimicrobiia bacterium]
MIGVMGTVGIIDRALLEAGTPERAEHERRYLKSDLVHYGVGIPDIRRITRAALARAGGLAHRDLMELIETLWSIPVHERRMAAVEVASARLRDLSVDDLGLLESMLRQAHTWALVDPLAIGVVGPLLDRHPHAADAVLDRWADDDDFWIRRSALLAHLAALRTGGGNWDRFCRHADAMLDEREFFIRKAIGWVLRDTARKRPDLVYEWILPRAERASGVTLREAVKRLSPTQAAAVMERSRRGARSGGP